ncbi:MAG TPA: hypothetical protein DEF07_10625 [Nitrosomonas sp.]|nr:hypothetical protein [Nitrosomonas sp.]
MSGPSIRSKHSGNVKGNRPYQVSEGVHFYSDQLRISKLNHDIITFFTYRSDLRSFPGQNLLISLFIKTLEIFDRQLLMPGRNLTATG